MSAPTHISFAEFLYLLLLTTTGVALSIPNAAVVALSAILPDIDTGASLLGRCVPPVAMYLERRFGHRTLTHSALALLVLAIVCAPAIVGGTDLAACVLLGYASHPLLDTCTPNGVKIFYPFSSVRCVFPLDVNAPHRFRVPTGSKFDRGLGAIFLFACVPAFYVAQQGYERFVRVTQHSIEAAVRDYTEFARENTVLLDAEAYNSLTGEALTGTFEVVGALNAHTLLFKGQDNRLHSIGKNFQADYVAERAVCSRGRASHASMRTIDMSYLCLSELSAFDDTASESYLFGELTATEPVSLPEHLRTFSPVTGSAKTVRFSYARSSDIRERHLENVLVERGIITVKTVRTDPSSDSARIGWAGETGLATAVCLLEAGEGLTLLKLQGESVQVGDTLARHARPAFFADQITLNAQKLDAARIRRAAALRDLDREIAEARIAANTDSIELADLKDLVARGFVSRACLSRSARKSLHSARVLLKFLQSHQLILQQGETEESHARLIDEELRAKADIAQMKSAVCAPASGVLREIRREAQGSKMKVIFFIKSR